MDNLSNGEQHLGNSIANFVELEQHNPNPSSYRFFINPVVLFKILSSIRKFNEKHLQSKA